MSTDSVHPDLERLEANARYARFLKVDLHVHTPAVPWCWNQHLLTGAPKAGTLKAKDLAAALVASGVDVAAITDHDSVLWVADVIKATRDLAKRQGRKLVILPGVEVTTYDGVHLLAIFPATKPVDEIQQMLVRFGLRADGTMTERAADAWPCAKVADQIRAEGGLVIAPHANHPKMGIWGGTNSEHSGKRVAWMRRGVARILACTPAQRDGLESAIRNAGVAEQFAFIRHSDAHSFAEIGKHATFIKLAEPTIEGIRQVIYEPDLRISMGAPAPAFHPAILGVELSGGYFDDELASFSAHLNVLIGSNYSGKSAILDAIRFVFDDPCFGDSDNRQALVKRISGILRDGQVRVWFRDASGSIYRAERSTVIEEIRKGGRLVYTPAAVATVSRIDDGVEVSVDAEPMELLRVDFYGQGSVGKVAEFKERHREMIDAMADHTSLAQTLVPDLDAAPGTLMRRLRANSEALQNVNAEQAALQAELAEIPALTEQRDKLTSQAKSPLLTGWAQWQDFNRAAVELRKDVDDLSGENDADTVAEGVLDGLTTLPDPAKELDPSATFVFHASEEFDRAVRDGAKSFSQIVEAGANQLKRALDEWTRTFDKQSKIVTKKFSELKLANEAALSRRISELKGRIEKIERKRPSLARLETKWETLKQERMQLMSELDANWNSLRDKRRAFIDSLNGSTTAQTHVAYDPSVDNSRLRSYLHGLVDARSNKSSLVQKRDAQLDLLVRHYTASDLSNDLVEGDAAALVERSAVTHNTAAFLTELPLAERLDVALYAADDSVAITWRREGDVAHSPLVDLSPGERALALLTVAFANRLSPLIIDQPEDELGQMLVTADLIDTIRAKKLERQFIVTHNANVPVLGDAEGIFHVHNTVQGSPPARRCTVKHAGSIECEPIKAALLGLEGGKASFEKRQRRYNIERASD